MRHLNKLLIVVTLLVIGLVASAAFANDGRINPPPYHFGGDALYCNHQEGCTLLSMTGQFLFNWSQAEIDAALAVLEQTGEKALVGEGVGTYGAATLWAAPPEKAGEPHRLCFFAYDEWGKQNYMCFGVLQDRYLPLTLAPALVATPEATPEPVPDCSMWSVGDFIIVIGTNNRGPIISIDPTTGTLVFENYDLPGEPATTARCDEVELGLT